METDARSSLGQSASETEEDTVSTSKKEVWGGTGSGQSGGRRVLGTNITSKMFSKQHCCFVLVPILIILYTFSFTRHKSFEF